MSLYGRVRARQALRDSLFRIFRLGRSLTVGLNAQPSKGE
jgi:hypothetical protein